MAPSSSLLPVGLLVSGLAVIIPAAAGAQTVHAVLFHSPTCPHCRQVITEDLPIFFQVYGGPPEPRQGTHDLSVLSNGTLAILFVDASRPGGNALFDASFASHPVGTDRRGVPRMIVGDSVLIGAVEIPARLHTIIRAGLAAGGIPWPAIRGLEAVVPPLDHPDAVAPVAGADSARNDPTTVPRMPTSPAVIDSAPAADGRPGQPPDTAGVAAPAETVRPVPPVSQFQDLVTPSGPGVRERFRHDPVGNGLAVLGLVVMVLALAAVGAGIPARVGPREPGLWLPLLAVLGAGVAAYLAYIETSGATAMCGPVGDCNTVQQSEYARLFGAVPVGVVGILGYGFVIVLWVLGQEGRRAAAGARRLLVGAALVGTLFSVYLTVLEPFVIGATCLWCLSSAAIMTTVLWLAAAWGAAMRT